MELAGRVAIVTGAAGAGIGQADVWALARNGANVVVSDSHHSRPFALANKVKESTGTDTLGIQCDVSKRDQVEKMIEKTMDRFGHIDILVNNAGTNRVFPIWEVTEEIWNMVIDINLTGVFHCTQAVLPFMMKQRKGSIINMSSIAAYVCSPMDAAAYCSAKAGVIAFTKEVAKEVGQYNIRINAITPSVIWNEFLAHVPGLKQEDLEEIKKETPLGRFGNPEEIANAVVFLASDKSSFTSGTVISITGGYHTW